jgi:hypothetical protein
MGANGECDSSQNDSDQQQCKRDVESDRDEGERLREGGEQDGDGNDQPHMVGFPDGPDGPVDQGALFLLLRPERQERPHAGTEIGSSKEDITGQGAD